MADALVSRVLEKLNSIVLDGIKEEVRLIVAVKKEIKSLTDTLTIIQTVLQDAEARQMKNKAVKFWLEELKDISYDAEDILDDWSTKSLIHNVQHPDLNASVFRKVRSHFFSLFSCMKPNVIGHDLDNKIRELYKRLVEVGENAQLFNPREISTNKQHRPLSSFIVDVAEIYGRAVDKDVILTKILDESSHHDSHVPVISIVGTCGFGRTTLAQLILEQTKKLTEFKFAKHMWVCVSDLTDLYEVMKAILEQVEGYVPYINEFEHLQRCLYESVCNKLFILVLDDVWHHNDNNWRQLKQALNVGAKGSRILITTRDERVAKMMDSSYTHLLGPLSDDDCWSLFKHVAFSRREDDLDKFEDIGKAISEKCNGVPLAARAIASLMRFKRTQREWRDVLASDIWKVQEGDGEGFLPSILRSYYALPSYLQPCLRYLAVFPKDAIFEKEETIQLWMAQGYLGSNDDGSADPEMKGRDYFDNLMLLSFLQILKRDNKGNITSCKMHNFVHNFVQFVSKTEIIDFGNEPLFSSNNIRHLCAQDLNLSSIYRKKKLRTLRSTSTRTNCKGNGTLTLDLLHNFQCLRVLSLRGYQFKELPSEVEQLLQLRYLDLFDNSMLELLPETICNLLHLQTLKLKRCKYLIRLPKSIGKLSNLRHLEIEACGLKHSFHEFIGIPMTTSDDTSGIGGGGRGRGEFPSLTNLSLFGMTEWEEEGGCCNNNGIIIMPCLSKLSIYDCPKIKVIPFYMFSHTLRELAIQICPQLTGIQPRLPPLLEKLKFEGDVGDLSCSLLHLLLDNPNNYPNLNYLEISDSSQLSLPQGFSLLTSIRQLVFHNCEFLDFMADDLKHLTMLEQLEISYCPILARRFSKGDISSSSSPSYKIFIRQEQRELTEIGESSH